MPLVPFCPVPLCLLPMCAMVKAGAVLRLLRSAASPAALLFCIILYLSWSACPLELLTKGSLRWLLSPSCKELLLRQSGESLPNWCHGEVVPLVWSVQVVVCLFLPLYRVEQGHWMCWNDFPHVGSSTQQCKLVWTASRSPTAGPPHACVCVDLDPFVLCP